MAVVLMVAYCCYPGLTGSTLIGEHVSGTEERQRALHVEDSSSVAAAAPATACCNASAFRENVIIGGGSSMGPIVKTRTTMDCCNRCQSNAACGCCECALPSCHESSSPHRYSPQPYQ